MPNQDVVIQANMNFDDNVKIRPTPTYMVDTAKGKFIAVKMEEYPFYLKCVGFFAPPKSKSTVDKLIKSTENDKFIEIMFPWHKVEDIQNLLYKYKGSK